MSDDSSNESTSEAPAEAKGIESIAADVAAAVDEASAKLKDEPAEEKAPEPTEAEAAEEIEEAVEDDSSSEDIQDEALSLSDEAIERAIKAGFSLSEAKQFPSEALLTATCARIEGQAKDSSSQSGAGETGEDSPAGIDDLLNEIPALDPNELDEAIVGAFDKLKEIVKRQDEAIKRMSAGQKEDWLASKLKTVEEFVKGDAGKAAALRKTFDALRVGFKSTGESVSDETIFEQAAKLVLGPDMEAAKAEKKKATAKRRSAQIIQRTTGVKSSPKGGDARSEIASMINEKFFAQR